jgi:hypothetical protein
MTLRPLIYIAFLLLLAGCDMQQVQALLADPRVAQREADAKAIGSACRHGLRSIEDCYALNEKASKSAVFAGWKEMDQYMRDNKIEGIAPTGIKPPAPAPTEEVITEGGEGDTKDGKSKTKTAKAGGDKSSAH